MCATAPRDRTDDEHDKATIRLGWLEWALVVTVVVLVLQIFPQPVWWALGALDFREWSRTTWFVLNLLFVIVVLGIYVWRGR
jgi:hypothetical protein